MFMLFFFWVGKQALLLVFVLLLARTADLKTWNPQREGEKEQDALFLWLSLQGAAATERPHLAHELSKANQEAVRHDGSCSHISLLLRSTVPGPAHISAHSDSAAGVTGSWMQSFPFSHESLMPHAEGPAPFPSYDFDLYKMAVCMSKPYAITFLSAALRGHGAKVTNGSIRKSELAKLLCRNHTN